MTASTSSQSGSLATRAEDIPDELLDETLFDRMKRRLGGLRRSSRLSSIPMDISNLSMHPQFESTRMSFNLGSQEERTSGNSPNEKATATGRSKRRKTKINLLNELQEEDYEENAVKKKPRLSHAIEMQGNQLNQLDVGNTSLRSAAGRKNLNLVEGQLGLDLGVRVREEKTRDISLSRDHERGSAKQSETVRVTRARSVHVAEEGVDQGILRSRPSRPSDAEHGQGEEKHDNSCLSEQSPSKVYRMKANRSAASTSTQHYSRDSSRIREDDDEKEIVNRTRTRGMGDASPRLRDALEEPSPSKVYRMKTNQSVASTSRQHDSRNSSSVREDDKEEEIVNRTRTRGMGDASPRLRDALEEPSPSKVYRMKTNQSVASTSRQHDSRNSSSVREDDKEEEIVNRTRTRGMGVASPNRLKNALEEPSPSKVYRMKTNRSAASTLSQHDSRDSSKVREDDREEEIVNRTRTRGMGDASPRLRDALEEPSPSKVYRMKTNQSVASTSSKHDSRDSSRIREVGEKEPGNTTWTKRKGDASLNRTRGSVFVPETCPDLEEDEEMPSIDDVTIPETQPVPGDPNEDNVESDSEPVRPRQSNRSRQIVESESEYARSVRSGRVATDNSDGASSRVSRKSTNYQQRSSGRQRDGQDASEMEVEDEEVTDVEPMRRNVQETISNRSEGADSNVSRRTDSSPSIKKIAEVVEKPSKIRKERELTPNKRRVSPRKSYAPSPFQDSPRVEHHGTRNDGGELALDKRRVTPEKRRAPMKDSPRLKHYSGRDYKHLSTFNQRRVSPRKRYDPVQDSPRDEHDRERGDAVDRMSKSHGRQVERQNLKSPQSVKNVRTLVRAEIHNAGDNGDDESAVHVDLPEPQERGKEKVGHERELTGLGKARRLVKEDADVDDEDNDTTRTKQRRCSRKKLSVVHEEVEEHFGFDGTTEDGDVDANSDDDDDDDEPVPVDDDDDDVGNNGSADEDDDVAAPLVDNENDAAVGNGDDGSTADVDDDAAVGEGDDGSTADDGGVEVPADEDGDDNGSVNGDDYVDDHGSEDIDDDANDDLVNQQTTEEQAVKDSAPLIDRGDEQADSDNSSSISPGLGRGDRVGFQNVTLEDVRRNTGKRTTSTGTASRNVAETEDDDIGLFVVNDDAENDALVGKENRLEGSSGFVEKNLGSATQGRRGRIPGSFEISGIEPVARDQDKTNVTDRSTRLNQKNVADGNASRANTTKGGKAKKKKKNIPATTIHVDVRQHMKDRDFIHRQLDILAMPINPTDPLVMNVYNKLTAQNVIDEHPIPKDVVQKVFDKVNKKVYEEVHGTFNPQEVQAMLSALDEMRGSTSAAGIDVDRTEKQLVALNVERVLETLPMSWPSTDRSNAAVERYNKLRRRASKLLASIEEEKKDHAQYKVTMDMVREVQTLRDSIDINQLAEEVKRSQHLVSQFNKLKKLEKRARNQESIAE